MTTEIELKYLVLNLADSDENTIAEHITKLLKHQQSSEQHCTFDVAVTQLKNCYFDTPELALRQLDMGYRIRQKKVLANSVNEVVKEGSNKDSVESIEQTIKTSGKVVGGLHQRPEYNVELSELTPNLPLFPEKIWPDEHTCGDIQSKLVPLFDTDFIRTTWLIHQGGSVIELAYDQGIVVCSKNNTSTNICELELELVSGNKQALFSLAQTLMPIIKMRPGHLSKAALGYALWHEAPAVVPSAKQAIGLELIPLPEQCTVTEAFLLGVEHSLAKLQHCISEYVDTPTLKSLAKISELLALLRQGFWLFKDLLTPAQIKIRDELSYFLRVIHWVDTAQHLQELTTKKGSYRKKIAKSDELIEKLQLAKSRYPDAQQIIELLHSERFNHLQLSLLKMLIANTDNDAEYTCVEHSADGSKQLVNFAKHQLSVSLQQLTEQMADGNALTKQQYLNLYSLLIRSLLTGSWFGLFFDQFGYSEARACFRMPWLDIKQGISELQTFHILQEQLAILDVPELKLHQWLEAKVDSLLQALEHSRQMALSIKPYWY